LEIAQKGNGSLTISAVEIHAAEKAKMSFDKECRAAKAAAAGSFGGEAPAVKKPSEDSAAGDDKRSRAGGGRGYGRGGAGGRGGKARASAGPAGGCY